MPTLTYPNLGKLPIKPTLQDLYRYGEGGAAYAFPDMSSLFQDAAGTVPVTAIGQQVYRVADISGRSNHLLQATANFQPLAARTPAGGVRNLLTHTEQFDNAVWTKTSVTVAGNAAVAPNGSLTAERITPSSVLGYAHGVSRILSLSGTYTLSCYAKAEGYGFLVFVFNNSSSTSISFNLTNGTIGANAGGYSASVEGVGDGWFRCSIAVTPSTGNNTIRIISRNDATVANWTPDGTSGLLIWGAQLEVSGGVTAYQRVASEWDVTEAGKKDCYCLYGDGVDDTMATAASVFPVRNGVSLVGAFNAVTPGSSATVATTFGIVGAGAVGFTLLTRRQSAIRQVGAYMRGADGAGVTPITNLANSGFEYGRPFITSATQDADNLKVLSKNPEGNVSVASLLGASVTASSSLRAFVVPNVSPLFWYGGIAIDRPLTDLERAFAMEQYAYLSGAIE